MERIGGCVFERQLPGGSRMRPQHGGDRQLPQGRFAAFLARLERAGARIGCKLKFVLLGLDAARPSQPAPPRFLGFRVTTLQRWCAVPPTKRFLFGWLLSVFVVFLWIIAVLVSAPGQHAFRWLKHDLTFSFVGLTFGPAAVGVFLGTINYGDFGRLSRLERWFGGLTLALMLVLATMLLMHNELDQPLTPFTVRAGAEALDLEVALRDQREQQIAQERSRAEADLTDRIVNAARTIGRDIRGSLPWSRTAQRQHVYSQHSVRTASRYWDLVKPLRHARIPDYRDALYSAGRRCNLALIPEVFQNTYFGGFVAVFLWYVLVLVNLGRDPLSAHQRKAILFIIAMLLLWVPFRVYANAYHSRPLEITKDILGEAGHGLGLVTDQWASDLRVGSSNTGSILLLVAGLIALVSAVLLFVKRVRRLAAIVSASQGILLAVAGLVTAIGGAAVVYDLGRAWSAVPFSLFLALLGATSISMFVIGWRVVEDDPVV